MRHMPVVVRMHLAFMLVLVLGVADDLLVGHRLDCHEAHLRCGEVLQKPFREPRSGRSRGSRAPSVDDGRHGHSYARSSDQASLRHATTTAYRCFLPDLTGFAGRRCTGPDRQRHATHAATAMPDLGREFSPARADCGYRAPLAPRLARHAHVTCGASSKTAERAGFEPASLSATRFPSGRTRPLCD